VFAFVNAPLFATFLLGMFWKRATGHGAFYGLLGGTLLAGIHHGLTVPAAPPNAIIPLIKGGWLGRIVHTYPSEMAQGFWTAIFAWSGCFLLTIIISLLTKTKKQESELKGLVYSLTPRLRDENAPWYRRPAILGSVVLILAIIINIIFW
jgi:solute:Na+ symporter, SSS family